MESFLGNDYPLLFLREELGVTSTFKTNKRSTFPYSAQLLCGIHCHRMLWKLKLSLDSQRTQQIHSRGAINHSGLHAASNSNLKCWLPETEKYLRNRISLYLCLILSLYTPSLCAPFVRFDRRRYFPYLFLWTSVNISRLL